MDRGIAAITKGSLVQSLGQGSKASATRRVHSFPGDPASQTGVDAVTSTTSYAWICSPMLSSACRTVGGISPLFFPDEIRHHFPDTHVHLFSFTLIDSPFRNLTCKHQATQLDCKWHYPGWQQSHQTCSRSWTRRARSDSGGFRKRA